jgi:hypothetical protein
MRERSCRQPIRRFRSEVQFGHGPRTPFSELRQLVEDFNPRQPGFQITTLGRKIRRRPAWTNNPAFLYAVCMTHPQRRKYAVRWVRIAIMYYWQSYDPIEIAQRLGGRETPKSIRRVIERLNARAKRMATDLREAGNTDHL